MTYMTNWMCDECYLVLDAVDEGQQEDCPKCGRVMSQVQIQGET